MNSLRRLSYLNSLLFLVVFISFPVYAALQNNRVLTLNMQGSTASQDNKWNVFIHRLALNHEVLTLQEVGPEHAIPTAAQHQRTINLGNSQYAVEEYLWNLGTSSRPIWRYIYFLEWDFNGHRVNLVTVTAQRHPVNTPLIYIPPQPRANGTVANTRPTFGVLQTDPNDNQQAAFFNIHAGAMGQHAYPFNDANNVVNAVRNTMTNTFGAATEWAIAGDFNQHPNLVPRLANDYVFRAFAPTHQNGNEIDFMFAHLNQQAPIPWLGHRIGINSDHVAVDFRLGGGAGAKQPDIQRNESDSQSPSTAETISFSLNTNLTPDCRVRTPGSGWNDQDPPASAAFLGVMNATVINDDTGDPLLFTQDEDGLIQYRSITVNNGNCEVGLPTDLEPEQTSIYSYFSDAPTTDDAVYLAAGDIGGRVDLYVNSVDINETFVPLSIHPAGLHFNPVLMNGTKGNMWLYSIDENGDLYRTNLDVDPNKRITTASAPKRVIQVQFQRRGSSNRIFALDADGVLYHQSQNNLGTFSAWTANYRSPVERFAQIAIAVDDYKDLLIMGIGFSGSVRYAWHKANGYWTGWKTLDSDINSTPLADYISLDISRTANNRLELLAATENGEIVHAIESTAYNFNSLSLHCNYPRRCLKTDNYPDVSKPETKIQLIAGVSPEEIEVALVDSDGDPVPDLEVEFVAISGRASFSVKKGKTNSEGKLRTQIRKDGTSTATIIVKYDSDRDGAPETGVPNGSPINYTFQTGG